MKVGIVLRVLSFICAIVSLFMLPPLLLALLDGKETPPPSPSPSASESC